MSALRKFGITIAALITAMLTAEQTLAGTKTIQGADAQKLYHVLAPLVPIGGLGFQSRSADVHCVLDEDIPYALTTTCDLSDHHAGGRETRLVTKISWKSKTVVVDEGASVLLLWVHFPPGDPGLGRGTMRCTKLYDEALMFECTIDEIEK